MCVCVLESLCVLASKCVLESLCACACVCARAGIIPLLEAENKTLTEGLVAMPSQPGCCPGPSSLLSASAVEPAFVTVCVCACRLAAALQPDEGGGPRGCGHVGDP